MRCSICGGHLTNQRCDDCGMIFPPEDRYTLHHTEDPNCPSHVEPGQKARPVSLAADYARRGGGVVAVMHDLNLTALFARRIVLMHKGQVLAQGAPDQVLTDDTLSRAYGCTIRVNAAPPQGIWVLPQAAIR